MTSEKESEKDISDEAQVILMNGMFLLISVHVVDFNAGNKNCKLLTLTVKDLFRSFKLFSLNVL